MKCILLTRNERAIVDKKVYDWLADYNWSTLISKKKYKYAARGLRLDGRYKKLYLHRLICGYPPYFLIKFINGNSLDCRKDNMLPINLSGKSERWVSGIGKSEYVGVRWHDDRGLWEGHFNDCHIGLFDNETDAARAYNAKAIDVFGPGADVNDIPFLPAKQARTYPGEEGRISFKTSKYRGVWQRGRDGKYMAVTYRDGKEIKIGEYKDEVEAANAYDQVAIHHGHVDKANAVG